MNVLLYISHVQYYWNLNMHVLCIPIHCTCLSMVGPQQYSGDFNIVLFYFSICVWWGPQHGYFILFLCFCIVGTLIHNQICYLELDWTEKIFKTSKDSRYQEKNTSIIGSQEPNARDAWTLIWMSLFGGDLNIAVLFYVSMNWCQIICNKHLQ